MQALFIGTVTFSMLVHIALVAVAVWRVWRGETVLDRLVAADVISTIVVAIFVLIALINRDALYMDVALAVAALTYIGTVALARYIANRQMF